MIRILVVGLLMLLPSGLVGQASFAIPSEGILGYRDLSNLQAATLMPEGESFDLVLLFGAEAIPVLVIPELIADENGRLGGVISLSWLDDDDTPRLVEMAASGRLRMGFSKTSDLRFPGPSVFLTAWDHQIDVRATSPAGELRIVGGSKGESRVDPTLSREWTMDLTSRIDRLGEASARARVVFGNESVARFGTTEGMFGADNPRLLNWSGDAVLVTPNGSRRNGGIMSMETSYFDTDGDVLGTFFIRAESGHVRTVVSGWLPVTYEEVAIDVAGGTFDFATLGLLPTNQLFATPAYTSRERLRWDDEFWDRGQVSLPFSDR